MFQRAWWIALIAGVFLSGCKTIPSKRASSGPNKGSREPEPEPYSPPPLQPSGVSPVKGLLAGQVLDKFDRKVSRASIQLIEVRDGKQTAPLEVWTDEHGYFTIPGLDPNAAYQLIARIKDGERFMAGTTYARPPDPRMVIRISEDYVSPATPPPPSMPAVPLTPPEKPRPAEERRPEEKKPAEPRPEEKSPEEKKPESKPAASLDRPLPARIEVPPPPPPPDPPASSDPPAEAPPVRTPRNDLRITIPPLSVPSSDRNDRSDRGVNRQRSPVASLPPVPLAPASYTSQPLPVPSCVMLTARQLDNFALQDLEGSTWEFRRDRKGRLVLIDFWHSRCGPCLRAIPHLNELQQAYAARGLEVVGIACEAGATFDQRTRQAQAARSRFDIRYRVLLWGDQGALKPCPVSTQLGVGAYPTLKLIDEHGTVVREWVGMGEREKYELRMEIERRLPLTR